MKNPGNQTQPSEPNEPAVVKHDGPQHTPGLWLVEHRQGNVRIVPDKPRGLRGTGWIIAHVGWNVQSTKLCERRNANARLIAAAPDMLTTLRVTLAMAEDFLTDPTQDQDHFLTALDGARAAIAKAVGDREIAPASGAST